MNHEPESINFLTDGVQPDISAGCDLELTLALR